MGSSKSFYFLFILAVVWFFNIGHVKLLRPDEGRYAEIPREMAATGDFVTPRLNNLKYFEKPPLQYWATAIFYKAFGASEATSRLWSALTGFLCVVATFIFAFQIGGFSRAVLSSLILISAPNFLVMGHLNTLDMGVTFFLTLVLLSLAILVQMTISAKQKLWSNLFFWVALALAFLSKGLMAFVIPGFVMFFYLIITRQFFIFKNINWTWGPLLCFLISAPWVYLVCAQNPEFFHFFFIHEHFERFLTKVHDRSGPWWYFIPILAGGFYPWTLFLKLKRWGSPLDSSRETRIRWLMILWSLGVFVFFSISSSKLPPYILPMYPALALLVAETIEFSLHNFAKWLRVLIGAFGILGLVLSYFLSSHQTKYASLDLFQNYAHSILWASVALLILVFATFSWRSRLSPHQQIQMLALAYLVFFQTLMWNYEYLSPAYSGYNLSQALKPYATDANVPLYSVAEYEQTLPFYLKRTVTLVQYKGELEFGIEQQPELWVQNIDEFAKKWRLETRAVAYFSPYVYSQIQKLDLPMVKIYEDARFVAVTTVSKNQ